MKSKRHITAINQLATQTVTSIEQEHNQRIFKKTHPACQTALVELKAHLKNEDIKLFINFYETFTKLQASDIQDKNNSFTCKTLALFLGKAGEIIINDYNRLSEIVAGVKVIEPETPEMQDALPDWEIVPTCEKVILKHDKKLSPVDKRVTLESNIRLMIILDKLPDMLGPQNPWPKINKIPLLYLFQAAVEKENIPCIQAILKSPLAVKQMTALCEKWNASPYTCKRMWTRTHAGISWVKEVDDLYEFLSTKMSHTNFEIVKLVTGSAWFIHVSRPETLQAHITVEMDNCRYGLPDDKPSSLEKIDFYLSAYKSTLQNEWLNTCFKYESDPEIKDLLSKHYSNIVAQYIPASYLCFFGTLKDNPTIPFFSPDVKNVLQKQCLDVVLPEILEPWKRG